MPKELIRQSSGGVELPTLLPIALGSLNNGGVELPVTLPFTFGSSKATVELPLALPFTFEQQGEVEVERKEILLNVKEECRYVVTNNSMKVPVKEQAYGKSVKIPITETALTFEGFVMEENVVTTMQSNLPLIDEVRNRILVDVSMLDRNTLMLEWYGEKVEKFDIYIRAIVDDEYQYYSTHTWDEKTATISIDDNAYYIQLVGHDGSGESFVVEVDVNTPLAIKSDVTISLNEKIYDIDVDYTSAYRFEVSL